MAVPMSKRAPIWLARQDEHDPELRPGYRRSVRYFRQLYRAWPSWCAEHPGFRAVYQEARRQRDAGRDVQVDHIVPICSDLVCGLHVPWNLRIVTRRANREKGNTRWPGCPYQQLSFITPYEQLPLF